MKSSEFTVTRWLSVKAEGKVALGVLAIVVLCSAGAFVGIWTLHLKLWRLGVLPER